VNTRANLIRTTLAGIGLFVFVAGATLGAPAPPNENDFVDIKTADPTIVIDLRYSTQNNFMHRPIYSAGMPALVRAGVAQRLAVAQKFLNARGYGLKIWDAYRPQNAQRQLWQAIRNGSYVADPKEGSGSNHTRGAAVDATLIDLSGKEVPMPTDFDSFTPAAMLTYHGGNAVVRSNLKLLQKAMAHGGFYGLRTEWWHFCAPNWSRYPLVPEIKLAAQGPAPVL
jgi:D-alanyl-D-alanine dipeptidase